MSTSTDKQDRIKRRSDMACTSCRARKLKCENKDSVPPCKRCKHDRKTDCVFLPVAEDKSPKSREVSESDHGQAHSAQTSVSSDRFTNGGMPAALPQHPFAPSPNYHLPPQEQSTPPSNGPLYPSPPYGEARTHWPGSNQQRPYRPQPSPYPNPANTVLAPSSYSYPEPPFGSDPPSSVVSTQCYNPMSTLPGYPQEDHPPYYPTNEQPSGVVYADPNNNFYQRSW